MEERPRVTVPILDEVQFSPPAETAATQALPETLGSFAGLMMDHQHLGVVLKEPYEDPTLALALADVDPERLFEELLDKTELFTEDIFLYAIDYYGNHIFHSVDELREPISNICRYAEDNESAAPDVKLKLRYVAKECLAQLAVSALPYLANHGNVCNLQKEIGIRAVYSCLTNASTAEGELDIDNRVRRLLLSFRELQLEQMYVSQDEKSWRGEDRGVGKVDSHDLANYRNAFSDYIGLKPIPDPDIQADYDVGTVAIYFRKFYTLETIAKFILSCANDSPRRLDYHAIVALLRYNRPDKWPVEEADEFLFHCFDDAGRFTPGAMYWMLYKLGVFKKADGQEPNIDLLFPPLDEIRISRSRENLLARSREAIQTVQIEDEVLRASREHISVAHSHDHLKCSHDKLK